MQTGLGMTNGGCCTHHFWSGMFSCTSSLKTVPTHPPPPGYSCLTPWGFSGTVTTISYPSLSQIWPFRPLPGFWHYSSRKMEFGGYLRLSYPVPGRKPGCNVRGQSQCAQRSRQTEVRREMERQRDQVKYFETILGDKSTLRCPRLLSLCKELFAKASLSWFCHI